MIKWIKQKFATRRQRIERSIILKYLGQPASPEELQKQKEAQEQAKREEKIIQIIYDPMTENVKVKEIQNAHTIPMQLMMISIADKTMTAHFNKAIMQRPDNQNRIVIPR
jgi:hypothetical protein